MELLRASVKKYSETKAQVDVAVATARTQRLAEEAEEEAAVGDAQLQQKVRRDDADSETASIRAEGPALQSPSHECPPAPHKRWALPL